MATINLNTGIGNGGVGTSTTTLQAFFNVLDAGQIGQSVNFQLFNPNSPCTPQVINLISGANTIDATACPALAQSSGVILIPPVGNGATLTLKGVTGDTGIPIAWEGAPTFLSFATTPPTSFVITANSAVTGMVLVWL